MGIMDKIRGEFVDIIEWLDNSQDKMVYRFPRYNNEIKYGAQLVVRESQVAVFIEKGQIADIFEPGTFELKTDNLPVLSTLKGWKHGFESPFKSEVYFVNTKRFTDLKWGTKGPIPMRDAEFGPIRLRSFGSYSIKVNDPAKFIRELVGTNGEIYTDEISDQLRNEIVSRFTDLLGESKIPALDLAASYDEFGEMLKNRVQQEFNEYGLELIKMLIDKISFPESVEQALDKRSSMGILGDMNKYTQFQAANAMEKASTAPGGGGLSEGMGLGMGMAMANQMGQAMSGQNQQANQAGGPPPLPGSVQFFVAVNGQQTGPFSMDLLKNKIATGEITPDSLVWKNGMAEWSKAGEVAEFAGLFGATPPPIPGS